MTYSMSRRYTVAGRAGIGPRRVIRLAPQTEVLVAPGGLGPAEESAAAAGEGLENEVLQHPPHHAGIRLSGEAR